MGAIGAKGKSISVPAIPDVAVLIPCAGLSHQFRSELSTSTDVEVVVLIIRTGLSRNREAVICISRLIAHVRVAEAVSETEVDERSDRVVGVERNSDDLAIGEPGAFEIEFRISDPGGGRGQLGDFVFTAEIGPDLFPLDQIVDVAVVAHEIKIGRASCRESVWRWA